MRVSLRGQELDLRDLSDLEFDSLRTLAGVLGKPVSKCPTCETKYEPDPREDAEPPTYQFRGETHLCDCRTQMALYLRYVLAGIPDEYMRLNWNADWHGDPEIAKIVSEYVENWESFKRHGWGLEFGGPHMGIGKTFAATHIGKELVKRRQRVFITPFVEMVSAFEKHYGDEVEPRIRMSTFVILDDIMAPRSDKQEHFYHTRFEAIIRHRTNHNLPTIITTNLTEDQLHEFYPRTYSLLAAKQARFDMQGNDARTGQIKMENYEFVINNEKKPIT